MIVLWFSSGDQVTKMGTPLLMRPACVAYRISLRTSILPGTCWDMCSRLRSIFRPASVKHVAHLTLVKSPATLCLFPLNRNSPSRALQIPVKPCDAWWRTEAKQSEYSSNIRLGSAHSCVHLNYGRWISQYMHSLWNFVQENTNRKVLIVSIK